MVAVGKVLSNKHMVVVVVVVVVVVLSGSGSTYDHLRSGLVGSGLLIYSYFY